MHTRQSLKGLITSFLIFFSSFALAQTPTPAQIEQFKRLPPAQQQALARSMGINLDDIQGLISGQTSSEAGLPQENVSGPRRPSANSETDPFLLEEAEDAEESEEDKSELQAFGYDLFELGADAFVPANDIPIPADYVMGPGDTLVIQLYGKESSSHSLTLSREGEIQFPEIGPVSLAGLSFQQAQNKIAEVVSEQMIGIKSSVTMGKLRTIRVFVLGDVNVPGSYVVGSLSTMTNALFASGGVSEIGSLRNIQLKRSGELVTTLDVYDLLLNGDTSGDARLLPGDVIFVPPVGPTAGAAGGVKRPALYELKGSTNVAQLISLAGGLSPKAYPEASKIERLTAEGERTFVSLDLGTSSRQSSIRDGDVLHIGTSLNLMEGTVIVEGHLKRPDERAWSPGLRFSDLISSPNKFLPLPDLDIGIIEREDKETRQSHVISFSPRLAFGAPGSDADPILQPRDKLSLFGYEENRAEILAELVGKLELQASIHQRHKVVRIDGSVRFPGEYPYTEEMDVRTLVSLAGGFTESALGREAEITRYELSDDRERIVLHIDVDLQGDNPKLLEGDTLRIQQIPLWQKKETITLSGEFVHPGTYAILPGETLVDVIERAGGLTAQAFPEGAIFSRAELRLLEEERLEELKQEVEADLATSQLEESAAKASIDEEEAAKILENIDSTTALGRMVIDLPDILRDPDEYDFQLEEGDVLDVPRYKPSVTIVGEVQYPTSHFYDKRLSVKDYLERSGGLKHKADKKRIYVVRANGMVFQPKGNGWFGGRNAKLNPGDTIIVPLDTNKVDKLQLWTSITQIMYNTGVGIAAILRI